MALENKLKGLMDALLSQAIASLHQTKSTVETMKTEIDALTPDTIPAKRRELLLLTRTTTFSIDKNFSSFLLAILTGDYFLTTQFPTLQKDFKALQKRIEASSDTSIGEVFSKTSELFFNWYCDLKEARIKKQQETGFSIRGKMLPFPPLLPTLIANPYTNREDIEKLITKYAELYKQKDVEVFLEFRDDKEKGILRLKADTLEKNTEEVLKQLKKSMADVLGYYPRLITDFTQFKEDFLAWLDEEKHTTCPDDITKTKEGELLRAAINLWAQYKKVDLLYLFVCTSLIQKLCLLTSEYPEFYPTDERI